MRYTTWIGLARVFCALLVAMAMTASQAAQAQPAMSPEWQLYRCAKCDTAAACDDPEVMLPSETGPVNRFEPREALGDTDLTHVDLDIELNMAAQNIRTGDCTLHLTSLVNGLTQFTFRLRDNMILTEARINNVVQPLGNVVQVDISTRRITLDRAYNAGEEFTIRLKYNGAPANLGFGSFSWTTHGPGSTRAVDSLSEPYYAYSWWPAKDGQVLTAGDNKDKFTLDMYLTVPTTMIAASNGLLDLDSSSNLPADPPTITVPRTRYHWEAYEYPTATYLVSLGATNYTTWTIPYNYPAGEDYAAGTMPLQFFVYPENDTPAGRAAWGAVADMMAAFRDCYGEYPFIKEKYGIYQFSFGGGMEHQTMTGQNGSSLTTTQEYLTAHELGHQWWGDNVTCRTWSDIWLNEGFATYTEALWQERKPGGSVAAYHAHMASRRPAATSGTVYRYDTSSASTIFSSTYAYNKAGWVVHMLRHRLGDAVFFQGLKDYRDTFEGSAATTDDFRNAMSASSGKDLTNFINQWVYNGGAPAYQLAWSAGTANGQPLLNVRIVQTQGGTPFEMPVDIRYTVAGQPHTQVVWNSHQTDHFCLKVEGNVTATSLDPDNWILHDPPTSTAYAPGPPKLFTTFPPPGGQLYGSLSNMTVSATFHVPVSTNSAHYSLVGQSVGAVPFSMSYNGPSQTATLTTPAPLANDVYTLTVDDAVTALSNGLSLDGELADSDDPASLPSGNGVTGGDAVVIFEVRRYPTDIDNNLVTDATDISLFVDVLLGINQNPVMVSRCNINGDSRTDADDIQPYLDYLEFAI